MRVSCLLATSAGQGEAPLAEATQAPLACAELGGESATSEPDVYEVLVHNAILQPATAK